MSRGLRLIRNPHAVRGIVRQRELAKPKTLAPWPMLSAPIDPLETVLRYRAQSALTGLPFRDGTTLCDALDIERARDVLAWLRPPT
jgi:hypothetical protein